MSLPCLRATQDKSLQHWYNEYIEFFECQATRRAEFNSYVKGSLSSWPDTPGLFIKVSWRHLWLFLQSAMEADRAASLYKDQVFLRDLWFDDLWTYGQ